MKEHEIYDVHTHHMINASEQNQMSCPDSIFNKRLLRHIYHDFSNLKAGYNKKPSKWINSGLWSKDISRAVFRNNVVRISQTLHDAKRSSTMEYIWDIPKNTPTDLMVTDM